MEKSLLQLEKLSVQFRGVLAVDNVDMTFEKGKIYGLIGTNGAGKSTVINMISGSIPPTSGTIRMEGRPIQGLPAHKTARLGIARTFQNLRLFGEFTVLENVVTARQSSQTFRLPQILLTTPDYRRKERLIQEESYEILKQVGIAGYASQRADSLPYGLQRRLEIARCLALQPKLLLLDEPAAGMNPNESLQLVEDIRRIHARAPEMTILLIEHDMKVVMGLCEYIYVMATGKVICAGTPETVRTSKEVVAAYLGGGHRA